MIEGPRVRAHLFWLDAMATSPPRRPITNRYERNEIKHDPFEINNLLLKSFISNLKSIKKRNHWDGR